jgi:hypothetical protein
MHLPPLPDGQLIHDRNYSVHSFRQADDRLVLRGVVHDQKPPGIYFEDDPEPLSVHHMVVDLTLAFPSLEITKADVWMNVTPHMGCSRIEPDYQQLVGLSIARGFSRKVKDLFGGPKGCTHIGALLQAMAPVAIQSSWSMRALSSAGMGMSPNGDATIAEKKQALAFNINTCHIWDEDGEQVHAVLSGGELEIPVWAEQRLTELGRDRSEWGRGR